ncbi:MAG: hypothetical protein WD401_00770 [Thermomicrobiaceae bacterium]
MQDHLDASTTEDSADPVLARRVDLTAVPLDIVAWIVVLAAAVAIRATGRTAWPLSPGESTIARDAFAFLHGDSLASSADAHPVTVQLTAFLFFMFGDSDAVARLLPLVAGIGVVTTLFWLRDWFGSLAAISIAIVWAISPVMTMTTLRLDGGALLVLMSLLVLSLTMTLPVTADRGKAVALGVALGFGLTSHPLGWVVIPLTLLPVMILVRDFRLGGRLLDTAATFAATLLIVCSWFLSRPAGLLSWFDQSLTALWNDHFMNIGADWPLTLIILLNDEPVLLILGTIGVVAILSRADWDTNVDPAVFVSCLAWAIPLTVLGILLDGKGQSLYAITVLPLVVLGGLGLAVLLDGARYIGWRGGQTAIWVAVVVGLVVASFRFAGMLAEGPEDDTIGWAVSAGILGLLVLLPLGYLTIRLASGSGTALVPASLLVMVILFGVIGLRTSLLLPSTSHDRPGEVMLLGSSTPSVRLLEDRLSTYSRDATAETRDVRDPEGGHGLMIVVEEPLDNPFAWYFRDFPNLQIVQGPDDIAAGTEPDVIIAPNESQNSWAESFEQHEARTYPVRYGDTGNVDPATSRSLLISAINPLEYDRIWEFLIYRNNPGLLEEQEMSILLREDHARAVWGSLPEE